MKQTIPGGCVLSVFKSLNPVEKVQGHMKKYKSRSTASARLFDFAALDKAEPLISTATRQKFELDPDLLP